MRKVKLTNGQLNFQIGIAIHIKFAIHANVDSRIIFRGVTINDGNRLLINPRL